MADYCIARIFHGPGHQSSTRCEYEAGHDDNHYCVYGEFYQEAQWFGGYPGEAPEVFTGFNDEPPLFPDLSGSESLAGVTLEEKWYELHPDWIPHVVKAQTEERVKVSTDEAAEFFANMTEETARAMCNVIPPRLLTEMYFGWTNRSTAPDWFAQAVEEAVRRAVAEHHKTGVYEASAPVDYIWPLVEERLRDYDRLGNDNVTLKVERNHAQRKLEELRAILRSNDD